MSTDGPHEKVPADLENCTSDGHGRSSGTLQTPGLRRTGLNPTAAAGGGDPAEAAAGAVRLALLPDDAPTGEFVSWDGTPVPW
jgi:hypothetical protein